MFLAKDPKQNRALTGAQVMPQSGAKAVTNTQHDARFRGDTSREALCAQYAALRRMTPSERLAIMDDLTQLVRSMTREGLRRRHPAISEAELDLLFFELVLGKALAARVLEHRHARSTRSAP